ncbi:MAG: type I restriction enzyme HsdR N-terminal domain-containing protein [Flavobacteriaceae bacterium]
MFELNLPTYPFKITLKNKKHYIFDVIRKKNIFLTPEEWVRQHFIQFLIKEKKYPVSLIAVEKEIKVNNLKKRFDILVFNNKGEHQIIVECKAPKVKITQATFDQIARYNMTLNAKYLIVTNGLEHFFCQMDFKNKTYLFLKDCPEYK